jgi:hypothetical protein
MNLHRLRRIFSRDSRDSRDSRGARGGRSRVKVIITTVILCDAVIMIGLLAARWANRTPGATSEIPEYAEVESVFVATEAPTGYPGFARHSWVSRTSTTPGMGDTLNRPRTAQHPNVQRGGARLPTAVGPF